MKRIEAVIPDADLRQVLLLISDRAKEIHVYDANPESPPEIKAETAKLSAPKTKSGRGGARPRLEGPSIKERILKLMPADGSPISAEFLAQEGIRQGYAESSFPAGAYELCGKGRLVRREAGLFSLPPAETTNQTEH